MFSPSLVSAVTEGLPARPPADAIRPPRSAKGCHLNPLSRNIQHRMEFEGGLEASVAPLWGELRYGGELARLLAGRALAGEPLRRRRHTHVQPVLLIPGFMAGDNSLTVMRSWLRGRGHEVAM